MHTSFVLLGLAVCSVWTPHITFGKYLQIPPWLILFIAATAVAMVDRIITPIGLLELAFLILFVSLTQLSITKCTRHSLMALVMLLSLMFASHKLPGFANPAVFTNVLISANAQPFSLSLNFDKGSAGLILLANFAPRITSVNQVKSLLLATVTAVAVISVIVFPIAGLIGYVTFDPKVPDHYMIFLANNLIFTCVAEEAFCRGVIQQGIAQTRPLACTSDPSEPLPDEVNKPSCRAVLGIAVSTTVFAFGHAKGGPLAVGFAALAGLGYAVVFARTQRIEASILTHLSINAIHFFCFTYPSLMR